MMYSCRSKSKVVFIEVSRYEGQLPRVDGVEVGLPGWLPATARRRPAMTLAPGRTRDASASDHWRSNHPRGDLTECMSMYPVVLDSALGPAHSGAAPARSLGKETTRGTLRAALDIIQKPAVEQGLLPV